MTVPLSFLRNHFTSLYLIVVEHFTSSPFYCSKKIVFILGKVSMEGKVEHKFDMKPHGSNIEEYGKLCRERTNKSMIKNRQIQVAIICHTFLR